MSQPPPPLHQGASGLYRAPPTSTFAFPWGPVLGISVIAGGGLLIWKYVIPSPEEIADGAVTIAEGAGDVAKVGIDVVEESADVVIEAADNIGNKTVDLVGGKVIAPVTKAVGKTVGTVWDNTLGRWIGEGGDIDKMIRWPWEE